VELTWIIDNYAYPQKEIVTTRNTRETDNAFCQTKNDENRKYTRLRPVMSARRSITRLQTTVHCFYTLTENIKNSSLFEKRTTRRTRRKRQVTVRYDFLGRMSDQ